MEDNEFHTVRGYQLLEQNKRLLTSAMEDYLEMICRNSDGRGFMRMSRLAELLNVKASSASKMVRKLGELGLLKYEKYGVVVLTQDGREIGEYLLRRHGVIESFLRSIGTTGNLLTETELIEHTIGPDTLRNIDVLNSFFRENPAMLKNYNGYKLGRSGTID